MTLPSSGPLAMSQMRDEYGLGNPVAMNQFYGKNGLPSSGVIRFGDFYGKSNYLDQQIVTVAKFDTFATQAYYGFKTGAGSCSDGTSNIYGGSAITKLNFRELVGSYAVFFAVASNVSNSGWTTMVINGVTFSRTDASFSSSKEWRWSLSTNANPFGTTVGAQITVTWY